MGQTLTATVLPDEFTSDGTFFFLGPPQTRLPYGAASLAQIGLLLPGSNVVQSAYVPNGGTSGSTFTCVDVDGLVHTVATVPGVTCAWTPDPYPISPAGLADPWQVPVRIVCTLPDGMAPTEFGVNLLLLNSGEPPPSGGHDFSNSIAFAGQSAFPPLSSSSSSSSFLSSSSSSSPAPSGAGGAGIASPPPAAAGAPGRHSLAGCGPVWEADPLPRASWREDLRAYLKALMTVPADAPRPVPAETP